MVALEEQALASVHHDTGYRPHCILIFHLYLYIYIYLYFILSEVYNSRILQIIQMFSKQVFTKVLVTATYSKCLLR